MNTEEYRATPYEALKHDICSVIDMQIEALDDKCAAFRSILEYYALTKEWDYGMKAKEILAKYDGGNE